jgi:NitT/TauT family transport system substrate-binding protein
MKGWVRGVSIALAIAGCGLGLTSCGKKTQSAATPATASADKTYNIGWVVYAGWVPWPYAEQAGIVKKWADKYHVKIKFVQINDFTESLNQLTAGKIDGLTATTLDTLTVPGAAGKDTTFLMIGDYSNGNDGIVLKNGKTIADIKGRSVNLVQYTVSHYLLARALESVGMKLSDVKVMNTSDADMVAAFTTPQTTAMVTWNPQLQEIKKTPGATEVFNSRKIPGEIIDTLAVDTATLKANPNLGKALTGIWYETLGLMTSNTPEGKAAREGMAKLSGTDLPGYEAQIADTFLYVKPADALAYTTSPGLVTATDRMRKFAFDQGLFGKGAKSVDDIGIAFPGGKVLGNPQNVKLRFDPTYISAAAKGEL